MDDLDAWSTKFVRYYNRYFVEEEGEEEDRLPASDFSARLAQFLYSPRGGRYRERFSFASSSSSSSSGGGLAKVQCGEEAPELRLAEVTFTHKVGGSLRFPISLQLF